MATYCISPMDHEPNQHQMSNGRNNCKRSIAEASFASNLTENERDAAEHTIKNGTKMPARECQLTQQYERSLPNNKLINSIIILSIVFRNIINHINQREREKECLCVCAHRKRPQNKLILLHLFI